jgi:hypothetical protein
MNRLCHYLRPFLSVESIEQRPEVGALELCQGDRALVLTVESGDFDAAFQTLEELRNPGSAIWAQARQQPSEGLSLLVDRLDRLGWLREGASEGGEKAIKEADEVGQLLRTGTDWLANAASCFDNTKNAARRGEYLAILSQFAEQASAYQRQDVLNAPAPASDGKTDIAGEALSLMLGRWRRTSPLALRLVCHLLVATRDYLNSGQRDPSGDLSDLDLTMSDPYEVSGQVWAAMVLLVLAASGHYRSDLARHVPQGNLGGPGLNVLVSAEAAAEQLMLRRGASPLLRLLEHNTYAERAVVGIHVHQYFITMHNIESTYTLLQHRLRQDLRKACTQYLTEEIGHEVHELETCRQLGVQDDELAKFSPLPFFSAYPEVLGAIAETDPFAYCLAISVSEGLPGAGKPLVSALEKRGIFGHDLAQHQSIDERLDHAMATRRIMQHVPWVESETARRSIQRFLFVVELSQLGWRQLAHYAEASELPAVPVTLGMSAQQILTTFCRGGGISDSA